MHRTPRDVRCSSSCWTLPPAEPFPEFPPTSLDSLTLPSTATSRFWTFNRIPFRSSCISAIRRICTDGRSAQARALGFAATAAPSYSSRPGSCPDGWVSAQLGTVTRLPVHPASPVLRTKNGPLGALDSVGWLNKAATPSYLFKYRCGPPPEFPLASPRSGIVHHLSGPDRHAHTQTLLRRSRSVGCAPVRDPANLLPYALRVYSPIDSHTCQTPWSVFQDGSNGEPTGRRPEHADAEARRDARAADHD
ncbi:hypothetical protein YC2023_082722 [Brassica napus]